MSIFVLYIYIYVYVMIRSFVVVCCMLLVQTMHKILMYKIILVLANIFFSSIMNRFLNLYAHHSCLLSMLLRSSFPNVSSRCFVKTFKVTCTKKIRYLFILSPFPFIDLSTSLIYTSSPYNTYSIGRYVFTFYI